MNLSKQHWLLSICWLVVVTSTASLPAQESWEFNPYKIEVWTALGGMAPTSEAYEETLQLHIRQRAEAVMQAAWSLGTATPPDELVADLGHNLTWISAEDIESADPDVLSQDKLMLVSVRGNPRGYQIRVREFDCRTRTFGPVMEREVRQTAQIPAAIFDSLLNAFAAMVRIEAGEGRTLTVRTRAGGLVLDRQSPAFIDVGDILQPIIRRNDRVGKPQSIEVVEWTFLQVASRSSTNPNVLEVAVHSGWRSPIRGRAGSRREQYALAIRPTGTDTPLFIEAKVRRDETPYSLPGLEIYAKIPSTEPPPQSLEERQEAEKRTPPEFLGYTDWRGLIEVGPGELPLRLVYIKNGGQLLARLPVVPGLQPREVAIVPDDDPRLQAEGFIKGFNGELMDLVAQRQILAARIRKRIGEQKANEAEELLEQFRTLPSRNDMQRRLDQQQNRQTVSPNRMVQSRIDNLFADTRKMLSKYLDPDLASELLREINSAKPSG